MKRKNENKLHNIRTICLSFTRVVLVAILMSHSYSVRATNFTVSNLNDAGIGSLRQALMDANSDGSATPVAPHIITITTAGQVNLLSALPVISNHITLNGHTDGNILYCVSNSFGVLQVGLGGWFVTLSKLSLNNGRATLGGGLYVRSGQTSIYDCSFINNQANSGGGGLCTEPAVVSFSMTNCTFSGNIGPYGGAIYNNCPAYWTNCTIVNNHGTNSGGIVYNNQLGALYITNCLASGNTGGGVHWHLTASNGNIMAQTNNLSIDNCGGCGIPWAYNSNANLGTLTQCGNLSYYPLLAGSNALDNGTTVGGSATDVCGTPRDATPNIGAWETVPVLPLTLNSSYTSITCAGTNDGTTTAIPSGGALPYTYLWSNGQTTATATGLAKGFYNVTVTDANGSTATTQNIYVASPALIRLTTSSTPTTCAGGDGTATISAIYGTGVKTYLWSTGQTDANLTGLAAGVYTVTATDANGCQRSTTVSVPIGDACVTVTATPNDVCYGSYAGVASVSVSGGTAPYSYQWSINTGYLTTASIGGLDPGVYPVTVTDANNARVITRVTINQHPIVSTTISKTDQLCAASCDGTTTINVTNGTAPYNYVWTNGATTASNTGLCQGAYYVTVTDANGCTSKKGILVFKPSELRAVASSSAASCAGSDGSASVAVSRGTSPYNYIWSSGHTTSTATGLIAGNYDVTITDANGCEKIVTVNVGTDCMVRLAENNTDVLDNGLSELEITGETNEVTTTDINEVLRRNDFPQVAEFNVYPNPTAGQFTIDINFSTEENVQVRIQDVLGRILYDENTQGQSIQVIVDASSWTGGAYFVQVISKNGQTTRRLIVTK